MFLKKFPRIFQILFKSRNKNIENKHAIGIISATLDFKQ